MSMVIDKNKKEKAMDGCMSAKATLIKFADYEPQMNYFFPITFVTTDDLESRGFDMAGVDNETMKRLAHKMEEEFLNESFFEIMERSALRLGIKKKRL